MTTGTESEPRRARAGTGDDWTVLRLILWSAEYLKGKGVASGRLDAEHLLAYVVGVGRLQLYLEYDRPLTPGELDGFRPLLKRRAKREPLQYIVGRQPFRELDLVVTPAVLIPRPETEVLVDEILSWAEEQGREDLKAIDVGTGSGAIALSLAIEGPFASVVATDIDEDALEVARRNRDAAQLAETVELRLGSLLDPVEANERFDVVTSNPPYVAESDADGLEPEVREWEPRDALFGGPDGLDVLTKLTGGAHSVLRQGGLLALEVGAGQAERVTTMLEGVGSYEDVTVKRDYTGRERIVLASCA